MRIVVTGKTGQIARSLLERAGAFGATIITLGRPELDLTAPGDPTALLAAGKPDLIVSAAAYTAVDKAESEHEAAFAVNAGGPRALAESAGKLGVPLLHISTDYVFGGTKSEPWTEDDAPRPLSIYGASKLAGDEAVLGTANGNIVVRVGWVYSPFGANFVKAILRLAGERDTLRVVADQIGGPTSALDIADGILAMARNVLAEPKKAELRGLFHMAPDGTASWADLAEAVCGWLGANRDRSVTVERITTQDYPTAARRPANSRLNADRLAFRHGIRLPPWRTSLHSVLDRLA